MKRKISGKEFLRDVRAGLTDDELMEKFRITSVTLQYIFRKLIQEGLMTHFEFYARSKLRESELFAAYSDEFEGYLRCPQCGQRLPDDGGECGSCESINLSVKSALPTAIFDYPGPSNSDSPSFQSGIPRKDQLE
jgi:hypothetical protein